MENEAKKRGGLAENLVPVLLLASVLLAFLVGVLWQKVSSLEKGGTTQVAGAANTGSAQPAANPSSKFANMPALAASIGVDEAKFKTCFESEKYKDRIDSDFNGGVEAGVSGTPGNFVINNKNEGWFLAGALPYETVKQVLDMALGKGTAVDLTNKGVSKMTIEQLSKLPKVSDKDHARGGSTPNVYLIEYSDFECPFCVRFHPTTKQALSEYPELLYVLRHYPLEQLHPYARQAALGSECITELGGEEAFWKFTDTVFAS